MTDINENLNPDSTEDSNVESEITEEEQKIDEKSEENQDEISEVESLKDSLKRLQADFINYKNRTNRERQQSIELANETLIMKLLPILDDLDRAISSKKEEDEFFNGVNLIRNNLVDTLSSFGLKEVDCSGKFNPNYHHAVITEDSDKEADSILEVFQKGYSLNNKCIRPAMVKVSK